MIIEDTIRDDDLIGQNTSAQLLPYEKGAMKRERKLTEKQLKFIDAFVKYHNAAKAARLAGYSARVSKQIGYSRYFLNGF